MLRINHNISALLIALLFSFSGLQASRFWVGNGGNWNDAAHWSTTSGGKAGATLPTALDVAIFDAKSFSAEGQVVVISGDVYVGGMDWSAVSNNPTLTGSPAEKITLYGPVFLAKDMHNEFAGSIDFISQSDAGYVGNLAGNDFKGVWTFLVQPENLVFKKRKGSGNQVLGPITSVTVIKTDATCGCEGTAKVTQVGGTAPYTYTYTPVGPYAGEPGDSIYNLCPKNYVVVLKDVLNQVNFKAFTIGGPNPALFVVPSPPVSNTCNKSCDGQLGAIGLGGTGAVTYLWNDGAAQTTSTATNLCAGNYSLVVTDAVGCTANYSDVVTEPTALVATITAKTNVACGGASTGAATGSASGGSSPYTYLWYDAAGQTTAAITNLAAGTYHIEITDSHGCKDTATAVITQPAPLALTATTDQNILCHGVCIGQVSYVGSGGTGALTYSWYDAPGLPTGTPVTNMCAGTYHVRVTDANLCTKTAVTSVTEPNALVATITDSTNVMCRGLCNGTADVGAVGGTAPYTYDWYNLFAQTTTHATGICAGASNVKVTDAKGCKDTATVTIVQPATTLFVNIVNQHNNVCFGTCIGDATVRPTGGTLPYTYNWYDTPGLEIDTFSNSLCANTYHVEVTDGNGCLDTIPVSITAPTKVTASFIDSIPLACNGNCNGSLTAAGAGGTPGYTYLWLAPVGPVTAIASGLCAGAYSVQVSDANGCKGVANYTLAEPLALNAAIGTQVNVTCHGLCTGQLTAAPTGGTAPYTYNWYDDANKSTVKVTGLCIGTYHAEVTDKNSCKDTALATITEPAALVASITDSTDLLCGNVCSGDATAAAAGGTAGYTYKWYNAGGQTTVKATNLCASIQNVEVTDANGCKDTAQVTIDSPVTMTSSITTLTNVQCHGACDGGAAVTALGGVAPLVYSWYDAPVDPATAAVSGLCPGLFHVSITDFNGCSVTDSATIIEPTAIALISGGQKNLSCKGTCDGTATVSAFGGTGPYTYNWYDAGNQITAKATALCAGTFNVEVTDAIGCKDTMTFVITEPALALDVVLTASTQATCSGVCNGTATVTASGGTAAYTYLWYDLVGAPSGPTRLTLCAGNHNVEVTDSKGCKDTVLVAITAPLVVVATITDSTNATCNGVCNGDATVAAVGGLAPYTYDWFTAGNQSTPLATGLCSNLHQVQLTDANGCLDTASVNITQPLALAASIIDSTNLSCNGVCIGDATADALGGTGPYTYSWYDVAGTPTTVIASALCAGTFHAEVTDSKGCIDTVAVHITEPTLLVAAIAKADISCNGLCNGTMTALPTAGGTAPYTYNWYDAGNQSTISISNLCVVTHNIEVTDANGCIDSAAASITEPLALSVLLSASTQPTCVGICNASAEVTPSGGTAPYAYNWYTSGNQILDSAVNVCAGNHFVEVTDAQFCTDTLSVVITAPVVVVATITDSTMNNCFGMCLGDATVSAVGGLLPYTYNWYNAGNQNGTIGVNLCSGVQGVEVKDINGCIDTAMVTITSPPAIVGTIIDSTNVLCNGVCIGTATVDAAGGVGPYGYIWYDIAGAPTTILVDSLCAGTYHVQITDASGCFDTVAVNITQPLVLSAAIVKTNIACNSMCNATMSALPTTGGTAPYTYNWYDDAAQSTIGIGNLCAVARHVEVTDANGCIDTATATISQPLPLAAVVIDSTPPRCVGICDASLKIASAGGVAPYTYNWYTAGNQILDSAVNMCAGNHDVEVTDANSCVDTIHFVIAPAPSLVASIVDSTNISCFGQCDGSATVGGAGGLAPYTYKWYSLGNDDSTVVLNLCAGIYGVEITDAKGCVDSVNAHVVTPLPLSIIKTSTNSVCNKDCSGTAIVIPSGGTAPYAHLWSNGATSSILVGLCAGTYIDSISDANGCYLIDSVIISDPVVVQTNAVAHNVSCPGMSNGLAYATPSGGTGPFTFSWDNGSTNDSLINVVAGVYTVIVTDSVGCADTATVSITAPPALALTMSHIDAICICNGEATVAVAGGTMPYTYLWNDAAAQDSAHAVALCAGNYEVAVQDSLGCRDSLAVAVINTSTLDGLVVSTTPTSCFSACDGAGTIRATGGDKPYTYLWNDIAATTDTTATNLCGINYSVKVTDSNSCVFNITVPIVSPPAVSGTPAVIMPLCFGDCNGTATVVPSGGNGAPYTHSWDTGSSNDSIFNLCVGTYNDTITDVNGCNGIVPVAVAQPPVLKTTPLKTNVTCNGAGNGTADANVSGGTAPYKYLWDNVAADTTATLAGLVPGTYRVTVTDANACSTLDSVVITEPLPLTSFIVDSTMVNCNCVGTSKVRASGGTLPYAFLWNDLGAQSDSVATGLCAGIYSVIVTDANACTSSSTVHINDISGFSASITGIVNVTCNAVCRGEANISTIGGTLPYSFVWNDPAAQTDSTAKLLCAGNYAGIVTDAAGCKFVLPTTITEPPAISIAMTTTDVICAGLCNGTLTALASGGTGSKFKYLYNDPLKQNTALADSLCHGTYTLVVTDSVGCTKTALYPIVEPFPLTAFVASAANVSCFSKCDGSINSLGVGGTAPYTYSWNSGPITKNISSLCANSYTITVTDAHGCIDDSTQTITEPSILLASIIDSTKITCNSLCDGKATALGIGGTAPYTYLWYDAPGLETVASAKNLCAQIYHSQITDAHGCKDTAQVHFVAPLALSVVQLSKTPVRCFNECNGAAVVLASGGTGILKYAWTGLQTIPNPSDLCGGINSVTVTDSNNCTKTLAVNIVQPGALTLQLLDTVHLKCSNICDGSIRALPMGGNGGWTYLWDDPAAQTDSIADALCAGIVNVVVTDKKGCQTAAGADINTANSFSASIVATSPLCFGDCNGSLKLKASGGVAPYFITWSGPGIPAGTTAVKLSNLCKGNYFATVTDNSASGCPIPVNKFLSQPNLLVLSISDSNNVLCHGDCTASATVTPQGGTAPYTYLWNDPAAQTSEIATKLCKGKFTVLVTDTNGCKKSTSVNLTEPPALASMNTTTPALCTNTNEGAIDETVVGGVLPYNFVWKGPNNYSVNSEDATALFSGKYYLKITDDNLCTLLDSAVVGAVTFIDANAGVDDTICRGDSVHLVGAGGVTYAWTGGPAKANYDLKPQNTAVYTLTVTSAGCTDQDAVKVTVNDQPVADIFSSKDIIIEGSSQVLNGSGAGIGGTYDWLPPISLDDPTLQNPTATPATTTKYILTVTTAAGCSDTTSRVLKVAKGIVFPDGITPNGDGKNETWVIDLIDQFPQCKVEIFNRWGQQVFQSVGYTAAWDGFFNNVPLPVGTYYYIIDLGPGIAKYTGPITLMR